VGRCLFPPPLSPIWVFGAPPSFFLSVTVFNWATTLRFFSPAFRFFFFFWWPRFSFFFFWDPLFQEVRSVGGPGIRPSLFFQVCRKSAFFGRLFSFPYFQKSSFEARFPFFFLGNFFFFSRLMSFPPPIFSSFWNFGGWFFLTMSAYGKGFFFFAS